MSLLHEEMKRAIKEIQETPAYLVGYYASGKYYPFNIYQDNETAKAYCDFFAENITHSDGVLIEWTVRKTTVGVGIDLINKGSEEKMNNQKEIKYRLQHKSTGQYVSYLGVEKYKKDSLLPEKIDAIEFVDDYEDAEVLTYECTDLDTSGKLIYDPTEKLELFYCTFFLDVEQVEEDEKYLFYSEDLDTYFDYIDIDTALNGAMSFRLDSVPSVSTYDLKNSGTSDEEIIELFEQNTNFHKVKVSDID